jgi:hypothetical protein
VPKKLARLAMFFADPGNGEIHDGDFGHMDPGAMHSLDVVALKEAESRLKSIITMHGEGRPHLELAQHLHQLESLIFDVKKVLVNAHLQQGGSSNIGYVPR